MKRNVVILSACIAGALMISGCAKPERVIWPAGVRAGAKVKLHTDNTALRDALDEAAATIANRRAVPTADLVYEVVRTEGEWLTLKRGLVEFSLPRERVVSLVIVTNS